MAELVLRIVVKDDGLITEADFSSDFFGRVSMPLTRLTDSQVQTVIEVLAAAVGFKHVDENNYSMVRSMLIATRRERTSRAKRKPPTFRPNGREPGRVRRVERPEPPAAR